MTEADFLDGYDPNAFPRPSVAVDLVLMTVKEGRLAALLQQRPNHPHKGDWALPGGFVGIEESLDDAAKRLMTTKAGLDEGWIEQLYSFGEPNRDPRMRVISVAYFALLPAAKFNATLAQRPDLVLAPLEVPWAGEVGGQVLALAETARPRILAFDHAEILGLAVKRLRGKLDYSKIGFALLPERFTLGELQGVHEAILGTEFNKPAFRRRMLDRGWIAGTGERQSGAAFRPAELYHLISKERT